MLIESFDVVFYTGIFVLPGYIISEIIAVFNPTKKLSEGALLLKCLLYSIIHCAIWSWLYKIVFEIGAQYPKAYWFILVLTTIIVASVLGTVIGLIQQKQLIRTMLTALKIHTSHSTPNSWDYRFSKNQSTWLIVTLVDGGMIYGWFSTQSFASSDAEERDLYIEKIYSIDDNNTWIENEMIEGIYIPKEQIKTIEFLKGE